MLFWISIYSEVNERMSGSLATEWSYVKNSRLENTCAKQDSWCAATTKLKRPLQQKKIQYRDPNPRPLHSDGGSRTSKKFKSKSQFESYIWGVELGNTTIGPGMHATIIFGCHAVTHVLECIHSTGNCVVSQLIQYSWVYYLVLSAKQIRHWWLGYDLKE